MTEFKGRIGRGRTSFDQNCRGPAEDASLTAIRVVGAGGGIELPFGGFKRSGHGREKGFEALYDMSATKTIVFNHG